MKIKNILKDPDLDERNERLLMIIIIRNPMPKVT